MRLLSGLFVIAFALACDVPSSSLQGSFGKVSRDELPTGLDASVSCQPAPPTNVVDVPGGRGARVAFVADALAVAAVTDAGVQVQLVTPGGGGVLRSFHRPAANLALGTSGGVLGVAWDSATTNASVEFAVVDSRSGVASAVSRLSPELGRSQEPVTASQPRVAASPTGFFVVWDDGRYAEPRGSGNLFGWRGLYGHAVDLLGEPRGADVQVVQTSGGSRFFDVAWAGSEWFTLWTRDDMPFSVSGRFSGQGYTPSREPTPFAVVSERSAAGVIRLAAGADGRVLAAIPFASPTGSPRVGTIVASRTGATPFTPWPETESAIWALAAVPGGFLAATATSLWQLDADGQRVRSQPLDFTAAGAGVVGDVSLEVVGKRVRLLFTLETQGGVSVWSTVACLP
ncbi:MAG: hypothetical protein JNM69_32885 [Archangium sp.]|nr:hypothetical protein [Archangium sp.]